MSHLLGFGDFDEAYVGVRKPPARSPVPGKSGKSAEKTVEIKPSKTKGRPWGTAVDKSHSPHKKSMVRTISAGKKALEAAKRGAALAAKYKPAAHAPLVKLVARVSQGKVTLGAAPVPGRKPLTPKQSVAVAKHTNAIAKHAMATRRLAALTKRANRAGKAALDFAKKTAPFLKAALAGQKKTRVGEILGLLEGVDVEMLGDDEVVALCDVLGIGVDAAGLNPGEEGYDPATDPSSASYVSPDVGPEPEEGVVLAPDGTVLYDPARDPDVIPMPERGGTLPQAEASAIWQKVPEDGVIYAGGFSDRDKGSYGSFYGPQKANGGSAGMIWGGGDGNWHAPLQSPSTRWIRRYGQQGGPDVTKFFAEGAIPLAGHFLQMMQIFGQGNDNWDDGFADDKAAWAQSQKDNQGPLIGNPNKPAVAGLQYAVADDKWFWQGKYAPAAATAEIDAKISLANQKTIQANTAAAQVEAARLAKIIFDENEKKAQQDAALALAQEKAEAEKVRVQTEAEAADITSKQQQEAERARADIEYQKQQDTLEAAQARESMEAARQEREQAAAQAREEREAAKQERELSTEQARAEQQMLVEQAAIYNEWARAHPEEAYAAQSQVQSEEATDPLEGEGEGEEFVPSMFEEGAQPEMVGEVSPDWPHDEDV